MHQRPETIPKSRSWCQTPVKNIKHHPNCKSGFEGHWRFLTGVWHLDLDLDMATDLWYTYIPIFGPLSCFRRCKKHPCPLGPDLGLWRTLEIPDWGFASWSWLGYGNWSLIYLYYKFQLSFLNLKVQRTSMSFKFWFWALEDAEGSSMGFWVLIFFGHGHWSLKHSCSKFWLSIFI